MHNLDMIRLPRLDAAGVTLYLKRDDRVDHEIGGNKIRKLIPNFDEARRASSEGIVTFSGPLSNHLVASAHAARRFCIPLAAYVRDDAAQPTEFTRMAQQLGVEIIFVDGSWFGRDLDPGFVETIRAAHPGWYIVPEGGSNTLGIKGAQSIVEEIVTDLGAYPDYILVACGTGGTLAGIVSGLSGHGFAVGISCWRSQGVLDRNVSTMIASVGPALENYSIDYRFDAGGFGKITPSLLAAIESWETQYGVWADSRFTGKLLHALSVLASEDAFPSGSTVVAIHSGLQATRLLDTERLKNH